MSQVEDPITSATPSTSNELVGLARLIQHARENNLAYLVATLAAIQLGLLQKLWTYGQGVC